MQSIKNFFHRLEAFFAALFFGFPARKLKIIGVTGTDGKTTTTHLIHHILATSGAKAGMISSIHAHIGGKSYDTGFHTTTPRAFSVQKILAKSAHNNDEFFVLETTSHALDQGRVAGVNFFIGVITNITREHLYYHHTFDEYFDAKMKLCAHAKQILINKDHDSYKKIAHYLKKTHQAFMSYSLSKKADYTWPKKTPIPIKGDFNKQNAMAAFAVCRQLGVDEKSIVHGVKTFSLPKGRYEIIQAQNIKVVVDFAHTPASILHILKTIHEEDLKKGGHIIHVFGAASERDNEKRTPMGEASGTYADLVILTEEDYRHENPQIICEEIAKGLKKKGFVYKTKKDMTINSHKAYTIITDRKEAIESAIALATQGDIVVATGKSHEKSLNRGGKEYPWDEFEAIYEALKNHHK